MAEQSVSVPYAGGSFSDDYYNVDYVKFTDTLYMELRFQNDPDFALVKVFNFDGSGNTIFSSPTLNVLKSKIYPFAIPYGSTSYVAGYNNSTRKVRLCRFNDTTALLRLGNSSTGLQHQYLVKIDPSTYEVTFSAVEFTHGQYRFDRNMVVGESRQNIRDPWENDDNLSYLYTTAVPQSSTNYWSSYHGSMKNVEDNVIVHFHRYSNKGVQILDLRLNPNTDVVTANCIAGYDNNNSGADSASEIKFKQNYTNAVTGETFSGNEVRYMLGTNNDSNYQQMFHECTDKNDNIWWTWVHRSNSLNQPYMTTIDNVYRIPCINYVKGSNNVADPTASVDAAYELYFRTPDANSSTNYVDFYQNQTSTQDSTAVIGSWLPISGAGGTTKWIQAGLNKFIVNGDPNSAGALPYLQSNGTALSNSSYNGIIIQSMWLDDDHFALCFANGASSSQSGASSLSNDMRINIYKYVDENLIQFVTQASRPGLYGVQNYSSDMHPFVKRDDYTIEYLGGRGTYILRAPE